MLSRGFYLTVAAALVIAASVIGLIWYSQRPTPEDAVYVPRKEVITPEITLLQKYIRIDTSNPPGLEAAGAQFLVAELQRAGIHPEVIEPAPGRPSVYARIKGRRPGEALMLLHHIDVVPADAKQWSHPPFAAEIAENKMYGRGTLDMKGIGIAQLLAFIDVAKSGQTPERDLVFLATSDEEEGSRLGVEWLVQNRPDVFEGVRYSLTEGGITETVREGVVYFAVEVGSKQMVTLEARASDRESLRRARLSLEPQMTSRDPDRISDGVRTYFRAIAPHRKQGGEVLRDIDKAVSEGKFWNVEPVYRALTQNSIVMSGPEKRAGAWVSEVVLVNLPDEEPETMIDAFRRRVAPFGLDVDVIRTMGPTRISATETPLFALLREHVKAIYGQHVTVGPFLPGDITTDSRYLRPRGITSYGFWPFPVDFFQSTGIHSIDERVRLDWFVSGVRLTRELVADYVSRTVV